MLSKSERQTMRDRYVTSGPMAYYFRDILAALDDLDAADAENERLRKVVLDFLAWDGSRPHTPDEWLAMMESLATDVPE